MCSISVKTGAFKILIFEIISVYEQHKSISVNLAA